MIGIKAKIKTKDLKKLITRFRKMATSTPPVMVRDVQQLGEAGYKYLKTIIPLSKLKHPHLRNHFKIIVSRQRRGMLLTITPFPRNQFFYAIVLDTGAQVPTRVPVTAKAMKFKDKTGKTIYRSRVKGFRTKGINFRKKGLKFLRSNIWRYVDRSLARYI